MPLRRSTARRGVQIRRVLVWSITLVALACVGACSGNDQSDGSRTELRIAISADPPSLDPGLSTDLVSPLIVSNLMDPLVRLDDDLQPEPALAKRWELSGDRRTITFHLRDDGRWTNGDPVHSRRLRVRLEANPRPGARCGICVPALRNRGRRPLQRLQTRLRPARSRVGVHALDERTLAVRLTSPQPWFLAQLALPSFLPVHRATAERYGREWTEPGNIVTNGPYRLTGWKHDESITLNEVGAVARCGRRRDRAVRGADHRGPDDRAERLRGGRARCVPRAGLPSTGRHRAAP